MSRLISDSRSRSFIKESKINAIAASYNFQSQVFELRINNQDYLKVKTNLSDLISDLTVEIIYNVSKRAFSTGESVKKWWEC